MRNKFHNFIENLLDFYEMGRARHGRFRTAGSF